ncbi:MAG: hypothetical protein RMK19_05610 [Bacteroidia bacterium]|nr:hypothetical protein [Bacteroidia bacterium]MDW8015471.1 hypothetical protein [Bacteroidia bacterium]
MREWICLLGAFVWAQGTSLPSDPEAFATALREALDRFKRPDISQRAEAFYLAWSAGELSLPEKKAIADLASRLNKKGLRPYPDLLSFVETALLLKNPESRIRVPVPQFIAISETLAAENLSALSRFWEITGKFVPEGIVNKTSVFTWRIDKSEARLAFYSYIDSTTFEEKRVPAFFFKRTNLICATGGVDIPVREVDGMLNLTNRHFIGTRGKADWSRLGISPTALYCEIQDFLVDMNIRRLSSAKATLYYPELLPHPVKGRFLDDFTVYTDYAKASTPVFEMTEGSIEIREFIPNTIYKGGFSLKGLTKYGSAVGDTLAELSVFAKGKQVLHVYLQNLAFDPKKLTSNEVSVELYLPFGDTIYYPVTDLIYDVASQDIILNRNRKNPRTRQGFYSTYHKMEMLFDAIIWNPLKDTVMRFTAIIDPKGKYGIVQSIDFFNQREYESYKDILPVNPIGATYRLLKEREKQGKGRRRKAIKYYITDTDILKSQGLDVKAFQERFRIRLQDIETYGFLKYDPQTGIVEPLSKLYRWAQAAFGEKDYDALRIFSNTDDGENARLDLQTKEITLRGVEVVVFADSHIVEIAPYKRTIYLGENRSMRFAGRLAAGKLDLYVRPEPRMQFDYENFKVIFINIDSLKFRPERDPIFQSGRYPRLARSLSSLNIENVSGNIYIDFPSNKSGKKVIPYYSILDCHSESYKYWDFPNIQDRQYTRDRLYFELDPFMIDSLEIFSMLGLEFHGVFFSDSVFPPFRDTLKVVPDGSYGIQETFDKGIVVYKGKGKFTGRVAMDNFGLHGRGEIQYLTGVAQADTFVFHFDSCMAEKARFLLPQSQYALARYPKVEAESLRFKWYPYLGQMIVETGSQPARLYGGEATFRGKLVYTPEGLFADGLLETGEARIVSSNFTLYPENLRAGNSRFVLLDAKNKKDTVFYAESIDLDYSIKLHQGDFISLKVGEPTITFPKQNISTSLGRGSYNRESGEIFLGAHVQDESKNFVVQRSKSGKELYFNTQILLCNLNKGTIEANRVDSIIVADATIFPEGGRVKFLSDGRTEPLENAVIKAPTRLNYHVLKEAYVQIRSGSEYTARGKYKYTDIDGKPQFIQMDSVYVQDGVTTARAKIRTEEEFLLTDRILFRDEVELRADRRYLYFKGEVRIQSNNEFLRDSWFAFEGVVNPDTVFIPIKDPKNRRGQELSVGIHFVQVYRTFYTNFLQPRRNKDDIDVLVAQGGLSVDRATKSFRIGPLSKLNGQTYKGNWVEYNDETRVTTAYGRLNFPAAFPPGGAQIAVAGMWREEQRFQKLSTDLIFALHFPNIPQPLAEAIASRFNLWSLALNDIEYKEQRFIEAIAELVDPDPSQPEVNTQEILQAAQRASMAKNVPFAKKLPVTLLLARVPFRRSDSTGALFVSADVGVAGIGGLGIAKYCPAKIEYAFGAYNPAERTRNPDVVTIYLEPTEGNWIFILYSGYTVRMITSDPGLNRQIRQAAEKQKDYNKDPSKPKLQLIAADPEEKEQFLQRYSAYLLN